MRVLLCGEGEHETGAGQVWCERTKQYLTTEGWLQAVCRNIRPDIVQFDTRSRQELFLDARVERKLGARPGGHGRKARLAKFIASNEEYDAVVFMADADSVDVRRWREIVGEIEAGFRSLPAEFTAAGVPSVPMGTSESWLMSDLQAWREIGLDDFCDLPLRPEEEWGHRDDPGGNHPHQQFHRNCIRAGVGDGSDTRNRLGQFSDVSQIAEKCTVSFPHFSNALQSV